jgi:hypothetical protein
MTEVQEDTARCSSRNQTLAAQRKVDEVVERVLRSMAAIKSMDTH